MTPLQKALLDWYAVHKRSLPWRSTRDPYRIWVSEVMLQQTRVATVVPYYEAFVGRYPDIRALAAASLEDVLKSWEGLGYYARARNLHRAAGIVVREMEAKIPRDYGVLRTLPGVGDYVAAAVASIAYGDPRAAIDGNVRRVLARLFLIDSPIGTAAAVHAFGERANYVIDRSNPGDFNQALMEFGAIVCTPQNPACGRCPVAAQCGARAASSQASYPARKKRRETPQYHVAVGVVRKDGKILITRRKEDGLLGGLWELPGGKVRPGEAAAEACRREIAEEVNLTVEVVGHVARVHHAYSHFRVEVDVFDCVYKAGDVALRGPTDYRWVLAEETARYPFPAVNHKVFKHLRRRDRGGPSDSP